MKVTTRERELTTSEKQKIQFSNIVNLEVERNNLIKVVWEGVEVGQLIIKVSGLEFNPVGGFKIDLDITNITPLKDNWE